MELAKKMNSSIGLKPKMNKKDIEEFDSSACEWRDHWIDEEIMDLEVIQRKFGVISKAKGDLESSLRNTLYAKDSEDEVAIKLKILKRIKNQREKDGGW